MNGRMPVLTYRSPTGDRATISPSLLLTHRLGHSLFGEGVNFLLEPVESDNPGHKVTGITPVVPLVNLVKGSATVNGGKPSLES